MLDEQAIRGHPVTVDHQAILAYVVGPANMSAMIRPPDPGVIDDGIVCIDLEVPDCLTRIGAAVTEEDIGQQNRVPVMLMMNNAPAHRSAEARER